MVKHLEALNHEQPSTALVMKGLRGMISLQLTALPNWQPSSGQLGRCPDSFSFCSSAVLLVPPLASNWKPEGKSTWGCRLPRQTHEAQSRTWKQKDKGEGSALFAIAAQGRGRFDLAKSGVNFWGSSPNGDTDCQRVVYLGTEKEYLMHVVPISVHGAVCSLTVMNTLAVLNTWPGVSKPWTR